MPVRTLKLPEIAFHSPWAGATSGLQAFDRRDRTATPCTSAKIGTAGGLDELGLGREVVIAAIIGVGIPSGK